MEPVRTLIHPAASPHKKNIKQAIPEERRQRRGGWREKEGERESERERERMDKMQYVSTAENNKS